MAPSVIVLILDLYLMINYIAGIFYPTKQLNRASILSDTMVINNR